MRDYCPIPFPHSHPDTRETHPGQHPTDGVRLVAQVTERVHTRMVQMDRTGKHVILDTADLARQYFEADAYPHTGDELPYGTSA